MATVRPSPPSLVLALCAALLMLFVVGVKGFSNGAPEESCGNMLPEHTHLGNPVGNTTCTSDCSTLEVIGYEGSNTFNYTCGRSYTLTVVANGIMVEAREASNSFNESSPYVGMFSVDESAELKTICEGNAVTQSQIQSGGTPLNFTWVAPGPGPLRSVRFWFTVVPAPAAYYAQLVGPVGEPDPSSCSCDMNEFIYQPPGSPDIMTVCLPCPDSSSSATGDTAVCECFPGTGRISEASGTLDPLENCTTCPGAPMDPTLTMSMPPDVTLTWSPPSAGAAWPLKYRVEWPNGTVLADSLTTTSVDIRGLNHLTEYSVVITALANSTSCMDGSVMYNFTTGQRCPNATLRFTITPVISLSNVTVVWDEPDITDPLVFDRRYALYSMCGGESTQTLQAEDLQSSSYTISDLPANTQCTVLVVMYSRHCARNLTGPLTDSVTFTTARDLPTAPPTDGPDAIVIEASDGAVSISITTQPDVMQYVCSYFSSSTPSTTIEVIRDNSPALTDWVIDIPEGGIYTVQCAGINADGVRGQFSSPVTLTVPDAPIATPPPAGSDTISFTVFIAVVVVLAFLLAAAIIFIVAFCIFYYMRRGKQYGVTNLPVSQENPSYQETQMFGRSEHSPTPVLPEEGELPKKVTTETFNVFADTKMEAST